MKILFRLILTLVLVLTLGGCATVPPYDYTAFKESRPRSILVMPPTNLSVEIDASHSVFSHVSLPLAESGYYVFPVAVVSETFKSNGIMSPEEAAAVPLDRLHEIFGADSVLYIEITDYGTSYQVIVSDTRVTASARLVDVHSGAVLWTGEATASSSENSGAGGGGLVGLLVQAVVEQILSNVTDQSYVIARLTCVRLLSAGSYNGVLYGPRSPNYEEN